MPWWGWMALGLFLLAAELLGVETAFYLLFIGVAAIVTGLLTLAVPLLPWVQWLIFAVLALVTMVTFRARVYAKFRGVGVDYQAGPAGAVIKLQSDLAPGDTCRQNFRGTVWTVLNSGNTALSAGDQARIVRVESLTLVVEAA
ncbi:MAG: NfeD family protein [Gammaproteobacteria bacterium]|jgi:membrane protein implicated in regulation of membrane protease activity|nr:NfeD family protein [Gammaproteobacteria bacterium]